MDQIKLEEHMLFLSMVLLEVFICLIYLSLRVVKYTNDILRMFICILVDHLSSTFSCTASSPPGKYLMCRRDERWTFP